MDAVPNIAPLGLMQEVRRRLHIATLALRGRIGAVVATATYSSSQATNCAGCGQHKHTPLRVDWMGGYVCLTCIDQEMERHEPEQQAEATSAIVRELDLLLDAQGQLLFAKDRCDPQQAEDFGVRLLDFMRRHGTDMRAALAADSANATPSGTR